MKIGTTPHSIASRFNSKNLTADNDFLMSRGPEGIRQGTSDFNSMESKELGNSRDGLHMTSTENLFIRENFEIRKENRLGKKLQPTRVATDALMNMKGSVHHSKGNSITPSDRDPKKIIKIESSSKFEQVRDPKGNIMLSDSERHLRVLNEKKLNLNKHKESPRMFLVSSQELDLRNSNAYEPRHTGTGPRIHQNTPDNFMAYPNNTDSKHKSTKSEAIIHMAPGIKKNPANYQSLNRVK